MADRTLKNLQRRLERLELEHLRQHALELHERLERAEAEAEACRASADFWHDHARMLEDELYETPPDATIGITKSGETMVLQSGEVH